MKNTDLINFGKNLKTLRKKNKITQLELAELLDLSPNFIGMLERGERNTAVENIFRIARALNVKPSKLFEDI